MKSPGWDLLQSEARNKVSGNRWIAKRANNDTKESQGASTDRLTKPKHEGLLGSGRNNWDFAQTQCKAKKKMQKVQLTCSVINFLMGSGPSLLCQPFFLPAPHSRPLDLPPELGVSC